MSSTWKIATVLAIKALKTQKHVQVLLAHYTTLILLKFEQQVDT